MTTFGAFVKIINLNIFFINFVIPQGVVKNVTTFGAFVDVGCGDDGLVHTSQMRGQTLLLGENVVVKVSVDLMLNVYC